MTFHASGSIGGPDKDEDIACSNYMRALLENKTQNISAINEYVLSKIKFINNFNNKNNIFENEIISNETEIKYNNFLKN